MSINRLGHLALSVTDLDLWTAFALEKLGLLETGRTADAVYFSSNDRHHQLIIRKGETYGATEIAFDVAQIDDWSVIRDRAEAAGLRTEILPDGADYTAKSFRFSVPDGPTFIICHGVKSVERSRYATTSVRPRKLGHVTLSGSDPAGFERVCEDVLGFRLSDRLPLGDFVAGDLTWYRCNTDHHALGLTPGPAGVHHFAWELDDIAAFARLGDHLNHQNVRFVWGPGRHGPGDNIFAYYPDPNGGMVEVYTDMQQITDDANHVLRDWGGVEKSGNLWGPLPDPKWFEYITPFVDAKTALARG